MWVARTSFGEPEKFEIRRRCNNARRTTGDPTRKQGLGNQSCQIDLSIELAEMLSTQTTNAVPATQNSKLVIPSDHPVKLVDGKG